MRGKMWIVARREFITTIKRPSWLIGTFGMPVFVGLYAGLIFLIASAGARMDKPTGKAGVVDHAGFVRYPSGPTSAMGAMTDETKKKLEQATTMAGKAGSDAMDMVKTLAVGTEFLPFEDEPKALEALARKDVGVVYIVPEDYIATGKVTAYDGSDSIFSEGRFGQAALRKLLLTSLTAGSLGEGVAARILSPVDVTTFNKRPDGTWAPRGLAEIVRRLGVPFAFTILLLVSILSSAGTLIQGVSEEKESRVIEVILSSIDARSLLVGKLFGLGGAGLLQLAIWLSMAVVPLILMIAGFALSPLIVVLCLVFFILGFLLYGTLITATGVIGTTAKDMQQIGMMWVFGIIAPVVFIEVLLRKPHGLTARVLSYVPFTSPTTMMLRIGAGGIPWWEIVLSIAWLTLTIVVVLRFAARIFRTGLLMYGKRPTIPEIFRWVRQA